MFRGEVNRRQLPVTKDFRGLITSTSGTNVTVMNLFGDMPVRVKQRANDTSTSLREWGDLKKQAAALLLCCPDTVTIELRDAEYLPPHKAKMTAVKDQQLSPSKSAQPSIKICSILYQAGFISSPLTSSWADVAGSTSKLQLHGAICLDPVPTKNIQFISIGITPIMNGEGHNVLYEAINKVFANSLFGVVDDLPELDEREKKRRAEDRRFKTDGYTNKELRGTGKGVDRWPMFALRIEIKDLPRIGRLHSTDDIFDDDNALASITNLLEQVAIGFLMENKLMPKSFSKQKSPTNRDLYDDLVSREDYLVQPRQVSNDTPRKKLQSAPASTNQSPKGPPRAPSPNNGATSVPITRTASPFDIWPRVKSGRTLNTPAAPKPRPTPGRSTTPTSSSRPSTPTLGKSTVHSTPPPRPMSTPAVSGRSAFTSSHLLKPDSIISKKGTVLALPFQDVSHTPAQRRDSAVSWTILNPVVADPEKAANQQSVKQLTVKLPQKSLILGDRRDEKLNSDAFHAQGELECRASRTAERRSSALAELEIDSGTRFTPIFNRNRSPEHDRGRRREPLGSWRMRTESWEGAYQHELDTFSEEHQRIPRRSNSPQKPTALPNSAPQPMQRHTASPLSTPSTKPLLASILRNEASAVDDVIVYKDSDGKETFMNSRTGQTVLHQISGLAQRPSSRKDRLSMRLPNSFSKDAADVEKKDDEKKASAFVLSVLKDFHNPAFKPITEPAIPQISNSSTTDSDANAILTGHKHNCSHIDINKASKSSVSAGGEIGRLSKEGLRNARVVNQVDDKFILIKMKEAGGDVLVLVDQHAADERIRIEGLLEDYFKPPNPALQFSGIGYPASGLQPGATVEILEKPISFEVDANEAQKLRLKQQYFARWGVCFGLRRSSTPGRLMVSITALSPGIVERCKLEPKLIINLIRKELYASLDKSSAATTTSNSSAPHTGEDWLERIHNIPQSILGMLNSRACRSAVMFNDTLSLAECRLLINKLSKTRFPFICAHGRPSMIPLVETGELGMYEDEKIMDMADCMAEMRREDWAEEDIRSLNG